MEHKSPKLKSLLLLFAIFDVGLGLRFTLVIPKLLYYDAVTVASVSAFDVSPDHNAEVTLVYRGAINNSVILNSTQLEFSSDGQQVWKVTFGWEYLQKLNERSVQLDMISGSKNQSLVLNFSQNFGHIFIQTDKPVYTPQQTVKFRVIAVDEQQRLAKYKVRIDIRNHKQVVVDRKVLTADEAFRAQEFDLPKEIPHGEWSITANFEGADHTPGRAHIVHFEVKEYVLAKFYTDYRIHPEVITSKTQTITISGTARYFHKRFVIGTIEMQLGTWDPYNRVQLLKHTPPVQLVNGSFHEEIQVRELFPINQDDLSEKRFYVKLNVTETATKDTDIIEDSYTCFSYSDYSVNFESSKSYFRPGFNYILQFQVLHQKGRPVSSFHVNIKSQFYKNKTVLLSEYATYNLDDHGKMKRDYSNIPEGTDNISFLVTFKDQMDYEGYTHTVKKYSNYQYIHISLAAPVTKYKNGLLHLNYTYHASVQDISHKKDSITVLVLSKGNIVFSNSTVRDGGITYVELPAYLYAKIAPRMRIIAYYLHNKEYVIDSLVVDTRHVCLDEVSLPTPHGQDKFQPKDKYQLQIFGSPNMLVGLAAVDQAVLHLSKGQRLTRDLMFAQLGAHDMGSASGDGKNTDEILSNSGLQHMTLIVEDIQRPSYSHQKYYLVLHNMPPEPPVARSTELQPLNRAEKMVQSSMYTPDDPPQTVRNYFPESWLFQEIKLKSTTEILNLTLPDSITNWSFLAVGLSSEQGVCVSIPLNERVFKLFFADIRLPYRAKRLEVVTVNITLFNYYEDNLQVYGTVSGSEGLCLSADKDYDPTRGVINFTENIKSKQIVGRTLKMIPLKKGDLSVMVDVRSHRANDTVAKKIHVVAEGQRIKKSITFVLDPEAKHALIDTNRNRKITVSKTATVNNVYDIKNKKQHTTIDLALPLEVIRGTEFCRIFAFGDLMGDIINHCVVESKNLIETPILDAEEVLGDLAPTVYALLYANTSGLMDAKLRARGEKFVTFSVTRLMKYMFDSNSSFALTNDSKPATWLTAFVLKTLCHASSLTYVAPETIEKGFNWLAEQVNDNGTLNEKDWRLAKDSLEYRIMLCAEVLIAMLECKKSDKVKLSKYLENNLENVKEPMVLAKVTYALMLSNDGTEKYNYGTEKYNEALNRLHDMKRRDNQGHMYWSNVEEKNETKQTPFWYHGGAQASAIEATAYALIIYVHHGDANADAIADWLIGQRNHHGAFIGAMDSTVAIQALSKYSLQKHGLEVDLHCNVSSDRLKEYFYSFKFTEENATHFESLNNVPVGEVIDVLTKGQGLGQMQVNVEYNIPIQKNAKCAFDVQAKATKTTPRFNDGTDSNSLCSSCNIGCPNDKRNSDYVKVKVSRAVLVRACKRIGPPFPEGSKCEKLQKKKKKNGEKKEKSKEVAKVHRQTRSTHGDEAMSKPSICVSVCIRHKRNPPAGQTEVKIEMLTGYKPLAYDLDRIRKMGNVRHVSFDENTEVMRVQFNEVPCKEKTCVVFRAEADESVGRLMPAVVEVIPVGAAAPQCIKEYKPPPGEQKSLQVYCSDINNSNKGECKCLSGLCSQCKPDTGDEYNLYKVKQLVCRSQIVYKVKVENVTDSGEWAEIDARVISVNKTGINNVTAGTLIKLITPNFCACPKKTYLKQAEEVYMLTTDMEKFVDRRGKTTQQYILSENSTFLRVTDDGSNKSDAPSEMHNHLQKSLSDSIECPK